MIQVPFLIPDITENDIQAVAETLRSGWITTGSKTKEFEKSIAKACNVDKAAALNSQTASAEMTLRVLGIGEGDEVIVPAYTYSATASVVCHVGAKPVIADCGRDSFEMDYENLADLMTPATKAVIGVDIAGIICDYSKLFDLAEAKKTLFTPKNEIQEAYGRCLVLADAAHSFGAVSNGRHSGEIADFSAFSFHAVKNLTTAEGGAAVWRSVAGVNDEELYRMYMLLSLHGQTKDAMAKTEGNWEYDIVAPYFKCNMTDIAASLGLSQFDRYSEMIRRRHEIIGVYDKAFRDLPVITPVHASGNFRSSGHLYLLRLAGRDAEYRNKIFRKMADAGVVCNVHYKPLPMLTAYKSMGYDISDYPNAYAMYENELTLPLYSKLTDEQVEAVIDVLAKALEQRP